MKEKQGKLTVFERVLGALGAFMSKLVWTAVGLVILAGVGRHLMISSAKTEDAAMQTRNAGPAETVVVEPGIPWYEIDQEMAEAMRASYTEAEAYADRQLDVWISELANRIDDDFLDWYFSYWQQQWMGLKSIGYWVAESNIVEKWFGEQPGVTARITYEIQEEFAKRVLRPEIAHMRIGRIARGTVEVYMAALRKRIEAVRARYTVPHNEWNEHLANIAVLSSRAEGNRQVALSLKAVAGGGAFTAAKTSKLLAPMIKKIGTKIYLKTGSKAVVKAAGKTGAKIAAKMGGKFLGPIVGIGVIVWDVWDHHRTKKIERPLLRRNLSAYLDELKFMLMKESETGLMAILGTMENDMLSSLTHQSA